MFGGEDGWAGNVENRRRNVVNADQPEIGLLGRLGRIEFAR